MKQKTPYRIRNWPAYNAALSGRGSLTMWVNEEAIRSWRYTGPTQRGAQYHYTDAAISCVLTLRAVYHLALPAAEGRTRSVFALLAVSLPVPSYSTLSRRAAELPVALGACPARPPRTWGSVSVAFKANAKGGGKGAQTAGARGG